MQRDEEDETQDSKFDIDKAGITIGLLINYVLKNLELAKDFDSTPLEMIDDKEIENLEVLYSRCKEIAELPIEELIKVNHKNKSINSDYLKLLYIIAEMTSFLKDGKNGRMHLEQSLEVLRWNDDKWSSARLVALILQSIDVKEKENDYPIYYDTTIEQLLSSKEIKEHLKALLNQHYSTFQKNLTPYELNLLNFEKDFKKPQLNFEVIPISNKLTQSQSYNEFKMNCDNIKHISLKINQNIRKLYLYDYVFDEDLYAYHGKLFVKLVSHKMIDVNFTDINNKSFSDYFINHYFKQLYLLEEDKFKNKGKYQIFKNVILLTSDLKALNEKIKQIGLDYFSQGMKTKVKSDKKMFASKIAEYRQHKYPYHLLDIIKYLPDEYLRQTLVNHVSPPKKQEKNLLNWIKDKKIITNKTVESTYPQDKVFSNMPTVAANQNNNNNEIRQHNEDVNQIQKKEKPSYPPGSEIEMEDWTHKNKDRNHKQNK